MIEDDSLNIANLPPDIIRKIVESKPIPVENMRFVKYSSRCIYPTKFILDFAILECPGSRVLRTTFKDSRNSANSSMLILASEFITERHCYPRARNDHYYSHRRAVWVRVFETFIRNKHTWSIRWIDNSKLLLIEDTSSSLQGNILYTIYVQIKNGSDDNNCLYEYLQELFFLTSRIQFLAFDSLSEDLIGKIEKAIPKLCVSVRTVEITVLNFSENLQWAIYFWISSYFKKNSEISHFK